MGKTVKYILQKLQKTVRLLSFQLVIKHGKHWRQTAGVCMRVVRVGAAQSDCTRNDRNAEYEGEEHRDGH